jgi:hypothetical protein
VRLAIQGEVRLDNKGIFDENIKIEKAIIIIAYFAVSFKFTKLKGGISIFLRIN